jgi:Ca2+-binding RTX toxin-like protein
MLSLLAGASDPDGDRLTVADLSTSSGTIQPIDGGWQFIPDEGKLGDVTLTYAISDGTYSISQHAHFSVVEAPPIVGTDGDDNLVGTPCADFIDGKKGNDNIDGRGGDDVIVGGDGNDHILGGTETMLYTQDQEMTLFSGGRERHNFWRCRQ